MDVKSTQTPLCARTETWAAKQIVALCEVGELLPVVYSRFLMDDGVSHHGVCTKESLCPIP